MFREYIVARQYVFTLMLQNERQRRNSMVGLEQLRHVFPQLQNVGHK